MTADIGQIRDRLFAEILLIEGEGVDTKALFHGVALAFGLSLLRYVEPAAAPAFLRQEADRIDQVLGR